ncbi:MAG: MMPL family transporter [Deltaproteobacteria bacterium]|nr:MMPL family transporter [Deltaproteobacteria bacterium]
MGFLYRSLGRLLNWTIQHPTLILIATALVTIASIYGSQKIRLISNFADLLPQDHPAVIRAKELEKIVGGASFVVVAVQTDRPEAADRFLTDLRHKIDGWEEIRTIDDHPPHEFFRKNGLLYLSLEELDQLHEKIQKGIEKEKLKKTRLFIDLEEGDGLAAEIEKFPDQYRGQFQILPRYQNQKGNLFVSLIKPAWRATDVSSTKAFLGKLEQVIADLNPKSYAPSLSVRFTGPYVKTLTQQKILLKDAFLVSLIAFAGALLYLLLHFGELRAVLLISIPLVISVSWSLGVTYLIFGSLNFFSSAAAAILLGIGVEYGIHFYTEYGRYCSEGEPPPMALKRSAKYLGRTFVVACSTTAASFFALSLSRFKALFEMGVIAGVGIILCALAFLFIFPPLVLTANKMRPGKAPIRAFKNLFRFEFNNLSKLSGKILSIKGFALISALLFLPLLTLGFGKLRFDYNLNNLFGTQETKSLDQEIDGIFNHTVNPEIILSRDRTEAGHIAEALRSNQRSKPKDRSMIAEALSLNDFIPKDQDQKRKKISKIASLFTPELLHKLPLKKKEIFDEFKSLLTPGDVTLEILPPQILDKFTDQNGELGRMVFVFPNFDMHEGEKFMQFYEEIRETHCEACQASFDTAGEWTLFHEIVKMLFREGKFVIGFSLLAILISFGIHYRSLQKTLLVFMPLGVGMAATLGWMGLLNIPFNIINLAAIPILFGIADDYNVHLFQRVHENPDLAPREILNNCFRPIIGSVLTTLIGFVSLGAANMGAVRSFGYVCVIGIFFCAVSTLLWFPALLTLMKKREEKRAPALIETFDESPTS